MLKGQIPYEEWAMYEDELDRCPRVEEAEDYHCLLEINLSKGSVDYGSDKEEG